MNSNGVHEICFLKFVNNKNAKGTRIWPLDCSYSTKSGLTSGKHEKQIKCAINLHCHVLLGWHPTLSKLTKIIHIKTCTQISKEQAAWLTTSL
jgi:hypothetical protein